MRALSLAIMAMACLAPSLALATPQEPDILVVDGKPNALETNPLRSLIDSETIDLPHSEEMSSSNWRGYVATWELREDRLFLKEICVQLLPPGADPDAELVPTDVLPRVFDGKTEVPADWYSGTLVLPKGELIHYVHMGYSSIYERYTVLRVKDGRLISREDLSAEQFILLRKKKFAEYQKTPGYAQRFEEVRSDLSAEEAEAFLFRFSVEEYMAADR